MARVAAGVGLVALVYGALPASAVPPPVSPWRSQVSGEQEHLHGIFALDGCRVWAVGEEVVGGQAVIVATKDGGAHWSPETFPVGSALGTTMNRVQFTDKNHGYAVGEGSQQQQQLSAPLANPPSLPNPNFLRSSNGGTTWVDLSANLVVIAGSDIEGLSAIGRKVWIAAGGSILYSSNRGDTWTIQTTQPGSGFSSVSMANDDQGWATSDGLSPKLWRTTDGGEHWNIVATTASSAEQVFAISGHKAVIAENGGNLQYTLNGTTLLNATLPVQVGTSDLTDVAIGEDGRGVAGGELNGAILATKDGGKTWTWQDSTVPGTTYNGVTVARDTKFAWATGEGGTIVANHAVEPACDA